MCISFYKCLLQTYNTNIVHLYKLSTKISGISKKIFPSSPLRRNGLRYRLPQSHAAVAVGGADFGRAKAAIEEKPADARTQMAFAGVKLRPFIPLFFGLGEQSGRPGIEERIDKLAPGGVELLPDILERGLAYIADNDAATRAAEDVAEGVDMHAFGT
jgi:hypothetical protein